MSEPIHYTTIPTQYAFLIEKTPEGYQVKTRIVTSPEPIKTFKTKKEVDEYIKRKVIL